MVDLGGFEPPTFSLFTPSVEWGFYSLLRNGPRAGLAVPARAVTWLGAPKPSGGLWPPGFPALAFS
jgi:hypothetical protein